MERSKSRSRIQHEDELAEEVVREETHQEHQQRSRKKLPRGCGSKGWQSQDIKHPKWVSQVRVSDDLRPKPAYDPVFIIEDGSKLHVSVCF